MNTEDDLETEKAEPLAWVGVGCVFSVVAWVILGLAVLKLLELLGGPP